MFPVGETPYDTYLINIRGRRRSEDFRYPKGLRIIDIIFKAIGSEDSTRQRLKDGDLAGDLGMTVEYFGFKLKKIAGDDGVLSSHVLLGYYDKVNTIEVDEAALEDL